MILCAVNSFLTIASSIAQLPLPLSPDYTPQIIAVCGTLAGTVLGWVLKYITENCGRIHIEVNDFDGEKDTAGKYAYTCVLYFFNQSYRTIIVRDIEICFSKNYKKNVINKPRIQNEKNYNYFSTRPQLEPISVGGNKHHEVKIIGLVEADDFRNIPNNSKIELVYRTKNGKIKTKKIKSKFSIDTVSKCDGKIID